MYFNLEKVKTHNLTEADFDPDQIVEVKGEKYNGMDTVLRYGIKDNIMYVLDERTVVEDCSCFLKAEDFILTVTPAGVPFTVSKQYFKDPDGWIEAERVTSFKEIRLSLLEKNERYVLSSQEFADIIYSNS